MNTTIPLVDRRNKTISTYVVFDLAAQLQELEVGDRVELLIDDFEPITRDIATWCEATGHRLLDSTTTPHGRSLTIERGSPRKNGSSLAMVISADGLEELLSPLGFALAAALEGMDVNLFFQGPAVRVLATGFRPRLRGWARPFSRFAAASMSRTGHIPAQQKLRQLVSLGASIYMCAPSMQHFKVRTEDLIFAELPQVEYLTFMHVMARSDVQLYN